MPTRADTTFDFEMRDFSGGLHTHLPPTKIAPNETPHCYDVVFDKGTVRKRNGYERIINDALTDPGLHFNGLYGHVRIPAHATFVYGSDFDIVMKLRIDLLPAANTRISLYCHGYAGGGSDDAAGGGVGGGGNLLRSVWIFLDNTGTDTFASGVITLGDGTNTSFRITHGTALAVDVNYSIRLRRHLEGATDRIEIQVYNLDTGAQHGVQVGVPVTVASAILDLSAFPIIVGGAPTLDAAITTIPRQSIGVDNSGGLRHAVGPGADISSRGVVAEIFDGTIGELQLWLGTDGSREAADDTLRLDTQDADVLAGKLAGYWLFNEGTGNEIGCSRDYGITGASSKDAEILGERAQYVAGLVGDATARHAIRFNGKDHYLHCIDRMYSQDIVVAPQTLEFAGLLERFFLSNDDNGFAANPWTFEFLFQFHKNPTEYNIAAGRKQCLSSLWYYFTDTSAGPVAWELPVFIFYIDTDNHLKVDILVQLSTATGVLLTRYETLDGGVALTKDTTYHAALMKYDDFGRYLLYVDGLEKATFDGTVSPGQGHPDYDAIVDGAQTHQVHLFFAMNNDKYVEWNDQTPAAGIAAAAGKGVGGYRTLAAMPSNCTIDEVRFWAHEDSGGNPVGARDNAGSVGATVPAGENPPDENLLLKYMDKELGAIVLDSETRTQEITERVGLWLYYDFREDWPDHLYYSDTHQWVIDNGRYRYLPAVLIPASNPPVWGRGVLLRTTVDSDHADNGIVHNPTGAIEMIQNFTLEDESQQLLHVQGSTLRSFETGNSYTNEAEGFQVGNLTSPALGKDSVYMAHGPRRTARWDGTALQMAGIAQPTAQIYSGYVLTQLRDGNEGNLLANKYYTYRFTWYNRDKNIESAPSPESPALFTSPANISSLGGTSDVEINLSIPNASQDEVTHIRIYRSEPLDAKDGDVQSDIAGRHSSARGTFWSLVAEIPASNPDSNLANTGGPSADTWWEGLPESMLGPQIETIGSGNTVFFRGYPPPTDPRYLVFWRERLFCARTSEHPGRLYFSEPAEPESFVPDSFLEFDEGDGQPITGIVPLMNYLVVFKTNSMYVVSEDSGGPNPFIRAPFSKFKLHTNVGCSSHFSAQKLDENQVLFLGQKGVYATDGRQVEYISRKIESLFQDEISKSRQTMAVATVYKKRNLYILALTSAGEEDNDIALVYDYFQRNWTRFWMPFATLTQTEDATGTERIFAGGVATQGYVFRKDSGLTDGAEFVRPASPVEPDNLTGSPNALIASSSTTIVGPTGNNWDSVTGDKLRGMLIEITRATTGAVTQHVIVYTDTSTATGRVTFFPALAFTPGSSDSYKIAGIRAEWDTPQFTFGKLGDRAALQDLDIYQEPQDTGTITAYLKIDKGSYQENTNTGDLTIYNSLVSFKGAFWATGGAVGAGKLHQLRLEQRDPNVPFDIHDIVLTISLMEGEQP